MSQHAATRQFQMPGMGAVRDSARQLTGYWWVLLVGGIAWVAAALVSLQFNNASVTTVGVLVGLMFVAVGIENLALAQFDAPMRWLWALFGVLFLRDVGVILPRQLAVSLLDLFRLGVTLDAEQLVVIFFCH